MQVAMRPDDLVQKCREAMDGGVDFPTLWHTIIKPHPAVAGVPVQQLDDAQRPYIEIPLIRGDRLVINFDAKIVHLR